MACFIALVMLLMLMGGCQKSHPQTLGTIEGKPVWDQELFDEIGESRLKRLGKESTYSEFKRRVAPLMVETLRRRVYERSLLVYARRAGTVVPEALVDAAVERQRNLSRKDVHAQKANGEIYVIDDSRLGFAKDRKTIHKRLLADEYERSQLERVAAVWRDEVVAYYDANPQEFNLRYVVRVRVIMVPDLREATAVDMALDRGYAFDKVAKHFSRYRKEQGGLSDPYISKKPVEEYEGLSSEKLNRAVRELTVGGHSRRIDLDRGHAWVKLERYERKVTRPLAEVYRAIEKKIYDQKYLKAKKKLKGRLLHDSKSTPIEEMAMKATIRAAKQYGKFGVEWPEWNKGGWNFSLDRFTRRMRQGK